MNIAAFCPRAAAAATNCAASVDLPVPGGADEQRAGAALDAAAQQGIQRRDTAGQLIERRRLAILSRDQPREDTSGRPGSIM